MMPNSMITIEELKLQGTSLGYSDTELRDYVLQQQQIAREERAKEREEKDKEREEKEKERAHEIRMLQLRTETRENQPAPNYVLPTYLPKLPPYCDGDDITAYLIRFERIAELLQISENDYAAHLGSLLSGRALQIYSSLTSETTDNYEQFKKALLIGFNKNPETYREEFRSARIATGDTYSQFIVQLGRSFDSWVKSRDVREDYIGLRDFMILDQLLSSINPSLRIYLKENNVLNLTEASKMCDNWASAHRNTNKQDNRRSNLSNDKRFGSGDLQEETNKRDPSVRRCFSCGDESHTRRNCPRNPASFIGQTNYKVQFSLEDKSHQKFVTSGTLNGSYVSTIVRDTGCSCIIVSEELLPDSDIVNCQKVTLQDYLGRKDEFPLIKCFLKCPYITGWINAVRAPIKMCSILIGNAPGVKDPWETNSLNVNLVETRSSVKNKSKPLHPLLLPTIDCVDFDYNSFKQIQSSCETLDQIRESIGKETTVETKNGFIYKFLVKKGLIVRECIKSPFKSVEGTDVLVIPAKCRLSVLKLAHESAIAGHFGHRKTEMRIKRQFFWPGMTRDIRSFCQSCDICQRMSPTSGKAPLEPMPIITEPFAKVGIDLVGPLNPLSSEGHRYIFTMIDYATGYPEAIPLKEITSIAVAEAMMVIFSRVGIPKEIVSDRGTQMTSELMGELHKMLGVKPLFTSPYHPMGNGRVERMHHTLKTCLKKLCSIKPKDWHRYLVPTLFALREIPSDRTGFSPFELIYGRQCRGPLRVLHDLWTDNSLDDNQRTLYQYVLELQEKLKQCSEIARETAQVSVEKYKTYFDLKSQNRQLHLTDEVLVLLPEEKNKLLVAWQGPFPIIEKRGRLNYVVKYKGKPKLFHINLLKKYHRRAKVNYADADCKSIPQETPYNCGTMYVCQASVVETTKDLEEGPSNIEILDTDSNGVETFKISKDLTEKQSRGLHKLIGTYSDVFSDLPGSTSTVIHSIKLQSSAPFRAKHYPIPLHLRSAFDNEVDKLLELKIIRPSSSPYSSPPLLVSKPDGSYRLTIDYRALNSITEFDAEPPCLPENELDKFHGAQFFSEFDITKAYHQIHLSSESCKFTAFPTTRGLMEYTRMPFGLVTAVASYIRLMRIVLANLVGVSFYFDNIFIYSKDWEEHLEIIQSVLDRLRKHGLTARPSKCSFGCKSVKYLGFEIENGIIKPIQSKVECLMHFQLPKTKKLLMSFLGLFSFYRKFVNNASEITAPLTQMLKKEIKEPLVWNSTALTNFQTLKTILTKEPILHLPDPTKTFVLRTDASLVGLGAILLQYTDDTPHPIAYASRTLLPAEKNYSVIERECLAIVWGINKFKYYLFGKAFVLEVDHKPLVYLNKFKGENSRLMRWALSLQPFRFNIVYIPGKENIGADLLSRSE